MHQTLAELPQSPGSLHIVYTSQLAPGQDYTAYGRICRVARQRNGPLAVSGVLLFDGQRFCQWLHGEPTSTAALMQTIASDRRHTDVQVHLQTSLPSDAFPSGWRAGFVDSDTLDQFVQQPPHGADRVMAALGRLLAAADVGPAVSQGMTGRAMQSRGCSSA